MDPHPLFSSLEKCSLAESKWRESRAVWSCSFDWPTRTHCMKLIKPIRGTGAQVEQGEVPIKIIDAVEALYTVKTTTDTDEATTVTKPRKKQKVSPNEDVRQLLAEKNGVKVITSDKTARYLNCHSSMDESLHTVATKGLRAVITSFRINFVSFLSSSIKFN